MSLAIQLADIADGVSATHFRSPGLKIERKADATVVTQVDQEIEERLRHHIHITRRSDGVLGEEYEETGGETGRRWIVDPIDGTANFVRGIPVFATLIALEDGDRLMLGVVSAPGLRRRWWARRGRGAFADGRRIGVSGVGSLSEAQLSYSGVQGFERMGGIERLLDLTRAVGRSRAFGDFWSHVLVAEGSAEIGLDPIAAPWDLAALQIVVEEAGGRFTDFEGRERFDGGGGISTNGALHDQVLRLLSE